METNQYLNDLYNHYDEDGRLASKHGSVEFLTTMHYIEKYIKSSDRVLEIGAGTDGIHTRAGAPGICRRRSGIDRAQYRDLSSEYLAGRKHNDHPGQRNGSVRFP